VKIFSGSFGGTTLWENPKYVSPAKLRQAYSKKAANKYELRVEKKAVYAATKPETGYPDIEGADFFKGDPMKKAEVLVQEEIKEEIEDEELDEYKVNKPTFTIKKSKSRPDMAIRRKQLKAKSKAISDQIKKRKQFKKRKP
ncbi:ribosome biogenesis protein BRX1 homolog, partial [Achroia grisella]|uniref:ribosome biogenesis protein BRX1 homolog n=1 Tax=Achroia grisella TaxID=688607 RepID=UPI0027D343D7